MKRKLIIAEKHDVAKAIAVALSGNDEQEKLNYKAGYIEQGEYNITWCFGHMFNLAAPEDIDSKYKEWAIELLPIYFRPWQIKPMPRTGEQLGYIKKLLAEADTVIHAGDPDEEGQLIVDELLEYFNYAGNVLRVLINDNNPEPIRKAFGNLRPNSDFALLSKSAISRREADMIFGINLSRFFTKRNSTDSRVGRVMTATQGLIVTRDLEIENFTPRKFYDVYCATANPKLILRYKPPKSDNDEDMRIYDKPSADELAHSLIGKKISVAVSGRTETASPPLPLNLTALQQIMSREHGINPSRTLEITQSLRENHKAITYNRSDCRYLNEEHHGEAPSVIVNAFANLGEPLSPMVDFNLKSRCFNSGKVAHHAHHAIIPTARRVNIEKLSAEEKAAYRSICIYYMLQFLPKAEYTTKKAEAVLADGSTLLKEKRKLTKPGFLAYTKSDEAGAITSENQDSDKELFELRDGTYNTEVVFAKAKERETTKPERYTYETLLKDMTNISKYITKERLRAALIEKDSDKDDEHGSIGTPATRADIIAKLLMDRVGYVKETPAGKLISTEKGRALYQSFPDSIKGPEVTARWYIIQKRIREGTSEIEELTEIVLRQVNGILNNKRIEKAGWKKDVESIGKCPYCGGSVHQNSKAYTCENTKLGECNFFVMQKNKFFTARGKKGINTGVMKTLLATGSADVKNFKKKDGSSTYDGTVKMILPEDRANGYVRFELSFGKK